jgi:4-hydroxy-tetrahydrodipicolinate reductase
MEKIANIAILGAGGRMGRALVQALAETDAAVLCAAVEHEGSDLIGRDIGLLSGTGASGVLVTTDVAAAMQACDAAIEFSIPAATVDHAALAERYGVPYVVGTTGLDAAAEQFVLKAASRAPVVYSGNYSVGMILLADLVRRAASGLSDEFDIEIVETHHRHKVDAPSGSALMLGRAAAAGRDVALDDVAVRGRDGITGARRKGTIGFAALRGGDVHGDHTVIFAGDGERLELTHRAGGRAIFARGAVRAALWAIGKPPGLYSMEDVLGLKPDSKPGLAPDIPKD